MVDHAPGGSKLKVRGALPVLPRMPARWLARLATLRPLPVLLLAGYALVPSGAGKEILHEPALEKAVALALRAQGLNADATEVHVLDPVPGAVRSRFATVRTLVRARRAEEPADIYLATLSLSPEGRLLSLAAVYNLSETSAVDERDLVVSGQHAAWVIAGGGRTYTLKVADLSGEPEPSGWTRLARWQGSITNLQQTGQRSGIGVRTFRLEPAAQKTTLAFDRGALAVDADGRKIRIPAGPGPIEGERFVQEQTPEKGRPGNLVTWAVDRVRAMPSFGSDRMQLVKAVGFQLLDWAERFMGGVTGDTGAERVKQELGGLADTPLAEFTDPVTGWPPAPMEPMLSPPLEGEGKWRLLEGDPYILTNPNAPAPFAQSFIRTDQKRAYTQIWVLTWDPRQVALHTMSGTVEPKSSTGETGPGLVPRKPEVMGRLIAAFNGGFQASHGEFGMMADGVVYLPPKPYAATVAELADGATAFGTWPDSEAVPDTVVSFRQNMTPLVLDDAVNPYKRTWWGGVPPGWTDESRTVRTALCLTKEGFVAYLYGASIDADHLTFAMQRARCTYGIHLDMNPGHTGLEFYRATPAAELPDVGHKLDPQWEATGDVSGMPGWSFIGRRMLRYMGLMNFPRYIQRESRDFFYLTLRNVLPGPNLPARISPAEAGEGAWTVKGLPQHGWPYSIATTWLRPDTSRGETKVLILRVDPSTVRVAGPSEGSERLILSLAPAADGKGPGLGLDAKGFTIGTRLESPLAVGHASAGLETVAALGIDAQGTLLYAEIATARDPARDGVLLEKLLADLGCQKTLFLSKPLGVALGGDRDLGGHPVPSRPTALRLVRRDPPGAARIFRDTPVVPISTWYPLQAKRVRYFRKPKPAEAGESPDTAPTGEGPGGSE